MPPLSGRRPPCQKYRYFFEHPLLTLTYFTDHDGVEWSRDQDDVYRRVTDEDRREYDACVEAARRSCQFCPIRAQCLRNALVDPAPAGVVAGLSTRELRSLRRTLGLAQPPDLLSGGDREQERLQEHRDAAHSVLGQFTDEELLNKADERRRRAELNRRTTVKAKQRARQKRVSAPARSSTTRETPESQSVSLPLFPQGSSSASQDRTGSRAPRGAAARRRAPSTTTRGRGEQLDLGFSRPFESNSVGVA